MLIVIFRRINEEFEAVVVPSGAKIHNLIQQSFEVQWYSFIIYQPSFVGVASASVNQCAEQNML